jgi:hypothetical protein
MLNRHLDQIILCTIYSISKINKLKLQFKDIIYNYKLFCENNRKITSLKIGKVNFYYLILFYYNKNRFYMMYIVMKTNIFH